MYDYNTYRRVIDVHLGTCIDYIVGFLSRYIEMHTSRKRKLMTLMKLLFMVIAILTDFFGEIDCFNLILELKKMTKYVKNYRAVGFAIV